jgi:hypothetical protein
VAVRTRLSSKFSHRYSVHRSRDDNCVSSIAVQIPVSGRRGIISAEQRRRASLRALCSRSSWCRDSSASRHPPIPFAPRRRFRGLRPFRVLARAHASVSGLEDSPLRHKSGRAMHHLPRDQRSSRTVRAARL